METTIAICEHIKDNNSRCGSPALKGRLFCWHHSRLRSARTVNGKLKITIGALETYNSIEISLAQIVQAVVDDQIPTTKANTLIRALRLAHTTIKSAYTPEKNALELPDSMLDMLGEAPAPIDSAFEEPTTDACHPERGQTPESKDPDAVHLTNDAATLSNHTTDEAWNGAAPNNNHEAWNGAAPNNNHEAWKSGASAPRSESVQVGASAPVDGSPDPQISRSPDSFASERSLRNGAGDDFLLREKRFTPDEIRAYWMQHVTDNIRNLKDPGTNTFVFRAPNWIPLSDDEIKHLKRHLPKSGIIPTHRENRNLRRLEFHEANQHYRPLTQDEMLSVPRVLKPTSYTYE